VTANGEPSEVRLGTVRLANGWRPHALRVAKAEATNLEGVRDLAVVKYPDISKAEAVRLFICDYLSTRAARDTIERVGAAAAAVAFVIEE